MDKINASIKKFRTRVLLKLDPYPAFKEYFDLTGKTDSEPFLKPETGPSVSRQNALIKIQVCRCRRNLLGIIAPKPSDRIQNPVSTHGLAKSPFKADSRMRLGSDEKPRTTWTADYSGGPRRGSYLGHKPAKNVTRNVGLPVRHV
jgi:hypothetical protein